MNKPVKGGAAQPIALFSNNGQPLLFDPESKALAIETVVNIYIKLGLLFEVQHVPAGEIADDASVSILFQTPSVVGALFSGSAGGDSETYLYEGPTVTDNGTELTPINLNRNSSNAPAMTVYHTPTLSDNGDLISHFFLPGGQGPLSTGNVSVPGRVWILKPNTFYAFYGYNRSGVAARAQINLNWIEA